MKRILVETAAGANMYIKRSFARGFSFCGYQTVFWEPSGKSAFDIFSEFDPEIFVGQSWTLNRATVKNLIRNKDIKVVLSTNHWGDKDDLYKKYPIEFATDQEKGFVQDLLKAGISVWGICQYADRYVCDTHNKWDSIGLHVNGLLLSADITTYFPPITKIEKFNNDITFVGGKWPYKAQNLDKYISPLLYPGTPWKVKIFGSGWSSPNCLGRCSDETARYFYANSVISPNCFEQHSVEFGHDVNQRTYEIGACGGFQISQRVKSVEEDIYNDYEIIFVDSPEGFFEQCKYFLNNPEETIPYRKLAMNTVFRKHTNLHRCIELFKLINEDCSPLTNKLEEIQGKFLSD